MMRGVVKVLTGGICVLALALAGCGGNDSSGGSAEGGASEEKAPTTVRIALIPALLTSSPAWVADKLGLWEKAGLSSVYVSAASGTALAQVVAADNADLTLIDVGGAATGIAAKTFEPVFMAGILDRYPGQLLCQPGLIPRGLEHKEIMERLAKLKVGSPGPGGGADTFYRKELRDAGVKLIESNLVTVGAAATGIAAMESKSIDCNWSVMPIPILMRGKAEPAIDYIAGEGSPRFAEDYNYAGWIFSRERAEKFPEFTEKVSGVLEQAVAFLRDPANAKEGAEMLTEYFPGLDIKDLEATLRQSAKTFSYGVTEAEVKNALDIYNELHPDAKVDVDPASLIFTPLKDKLQAAAEAEQAEEGQ
jgi:ABC-type nitrate/sulfonate/bicarbonate transport system substrate-binding protein